MKKLSYLELKKIRNAYTVCEPCGLLHGSIIPKTKPPFRKSRCNICIRMREVTDFKHYGFSKYPREN